MKRWKNRKCFESLSKGPVVVVEVVVIEVVVIRVTCQNLCTSFSAFALLFVLHLLDAKNLRLVFCFRVNKPALYSIKLGTLCATEYRYKSKKF